MFRTSLALAALATLVLVHPTVRACSVCGSGDPLVSAASAQPDKGTVRLSLGTTWLTARARSDDDPSNVESLSQINVDATVVYSPTAALNLVADLPLERKLWRLRDANGALTSRSDSFGLGDMRLSALYFPWQHIDWKRESRQDFGITVGSTLPTGPNDHHVGGARIDEHAQLGTGAFGPFVGVLYAYHQDPWNLFASVTGQFHTTNPHGYHYASAVQWTVRGQWRPLQWLAIEAGFDGRFNGKDRSAGAAQDNTGGLLLDASPALLVRLYDRLWLHARAQIPFYGKLNGDQHVGPVVSANIQYAFQ